MTSEVLLVRHAESTGHAPDEPLSARGRTQARDLAAYLATQPIDALISSPYRRAHETALALAGKRRVDLSLDARLQEWELPWIPAAAWPDALRPIFAARAPLEASIEPLAAARARGRAVLDEARARYRRSVLVTHGKLLALVLAALDGRDPFAAFQSLRNAQAFAVRETSSGPEVQTVWQPD